jgi:hypothetical protein
MADKKSRGVDELTIKLNVDTSDAIKALKAVQREARAAVKALRELEVVSGLDMERGLSTKEITKELIDREGVAHITVGPYEKLKITTGQRECELTGPAIVIINQD